MPEIDIYGDIKFKAEGHPYYIAVSTTDTDPMYVVLYRLFSNPDGYSEDVLEMAAGRLNRFKGVKMFCYTSAYRIGAELFVRDADHVMESFYKLKTIIDSASDKLMEECESIGSVGSVSVSEIPFIVTSFDVANTESNGNIIQDYGTSIWDFKTKYLKPRLSVKPFKSGTYTVYVKMYKNGTLTTGSNSPTGYSYSDSVTISGTSQHTVYLDGWGSTTAGHWSAGNYRFEVWYDGYCIGSKDFRVI